MFRARKPTQREQDIYNDAARRGVGPRRRKDPNYDPRLNPKGDSNAGGLVDSLDQVFGKSSPWSKHSKDKAVKGKKAGVSYPGWKPPRGPPTESVRSVDSGSEAGGEYIPPGWKPPRGPPTESVLSVDSGSEAGGEYIPPGSPPISVARQPVSQANERCAPANSASSSAAGGGGSQFSVSNKGSSESGTEGPASDTEGPPSDTESPYPLLRYSSKDKADIVRATAFHA